MGFSVVELGHGRARLTGSGFAGGEVTTMCNLNFAVLRDAATGFVVRDDTGTVVVTSRF